MKLLLATLIIFLILVMVRTRNCPDLKDFNVERTLSLRGILALLIILHHIAENFHEEEVFLIKEFADWGGIVVGMFFFITGYGLMVSYRRKGSAYLDGFVRHRLAKLLPPFLITMFLWRIYRSIFGDNIPFLSIESLMRGETPLPNSWFVYAILFFYLCFFIVARFATKPQRITVILWVLSSLYMIAMSFSDWGRWWYSTTYALNIGATFALYEDKLKTLLRRKQSLMLTVLVPILVLAYYTERTGNVWTEIIMRWFLPLYIVFTIYAIGICRFHLFQNLGKISYEIYLVHGCWILCLFGLCEISTTLYIVAVVAVSIFTAWLLHQVCENLIKKFI